MLEVHFKQLSAEALRNLIDYFVLREGTDYGQKEFSLDEKRRAVESLLQLGKAKILYDADSGSCNIVTKAEADRLLSG